MAKNTKENQLSNEEFAFLKTPAETSETRVRENLYVGNPSTTPRGLMLQRGLMILKPYEIRQVPLELEDEVRTLFKTEALQAMVDNGLFQIGNSPILQLKKQPTPTPPMELQVGVDVKSTGSKAVAGTSTDHIGGTEKMRLDSTFVTGVQ